MLESLLGGLGSLVGAFGGLFGNKGLSQRKAAQLEQHYAEKNAREMPAHQVAGWKAAGLNPSIMATGSTSTYSGPQIGAASYANPAEAIANGLLGLGDVANAFADDKTAAKHEKREEELHQAKLRALNNGFGQSSMPGVSMTYRAGGPTGTDRTGMLQEIIPGSKTSSGIDRADIENPRELETDAWAWALDGTLIENMGNVWNKNTQSNQAKDKAPARNRYDWPSFSQPLGTWGGLKSQLNQSLLGNRLYDKARQGPGAF